MLTTLTCLLAMTAAAPAKDLPKKGEAPSLIGEWTLDEGQVPFQKGELTLKFDDKGGMLLSMRVQGQKIDMKAAYKADSSKNPAEIDFIPPADQTDHTSLGIYKIDGDTLTICTDDSGKTRPAKFETLAANGAISLLKFKRVETPKEK